MAHGPLAHQLAPQSRSAIRPDNVRLALYAREQELAVLHEELVIYPDLAAPSGGAQIADHIPVQGGMILAAGLGVAVAQRQMHRAANLFVEENVADTTRDTGIVAERKFAQVARAAVQLEHLPQKGLPLRPRCLHHTPLRE